MSHVKIIPSTDKNYARNITQENMVIYYQKRKIEWDDQLFEQSWKDFDNFEVWCDQTRVGVVRFCIDDQDCRLRDLQIETNSQGRGIGTACLDFARQYALDNHCEKVWLRVFPENPAVKLYERAGFRTYSSGDDLCEMVMDYL
ncbi:GNAT family N-acetyltransferase [Veronia pacifica]|uniref:N-acetyltransferase domain-containing protein n=1 Tax=Veronia pacifica TaxID=1080227 RepID=A0A1C3EGD7_9GAMM|nr:GNAT family N-acetyltransferase [Veronia pacifica]ODA32274.1 hypothetical protein A8L45_13880 [Veronia pacifica]